jgi:polyvinyl alcohol dehydrogenase (cytochrome)
VEVDHRRPLVAVNARRLLAAASLVAALGATPAPAAAAAPKKPPPKPSCDARSVLAGEWRSYGRDLENTRHQAREKVISLADAPFLTPAWSFSTVEAAGEGDITGTPVVAGQCLYAATTEGWVFALNADSGRLVWKRRLPYGGGVNGTVVYAYGRVYAAATRLQKEKGCPKGDPCVGPYVVALDGRTGRVRFATRSLDTQPGSDVYGSPVVFPDSSRPNPRRIRDAVLMIGVSGGSAELGDEADRYAFQGSMTFLDPRTGRVLVKRWTIAKPVKDPKDDFAGAGIWSTPAVDARAKVAYAGTANPFRPQAEHRYANAVLKYGVNRRDRKTFGRILGSYKGNIDEYVPAFSQMPCVDIPNNYPPYYPQGVGQCGDIDLDFGAAPNIFRDAKGRVLVGEGQKSGVYHVLDGSTMKPVWSQVVGPPTPVGGVVGSTAYDGQRVIGPITVPGYLWSVAADGGAHQWVGPVADGVHWGNPVAVANGVVYTVDLAGFLDAFDARTGALVAKRPLALGGPRGLTASWAGVAIARHTVYAAVGIRGLPEGYVVAFRPGGPGDVPGDAQETAGGGNAGGGGGEGEGGGEGDEGGGGEGGEGGEAGGTSSSVVAGPGAYATTYATPAVTTSVGGPVSFVNFDIAQHDVVASDKGPDGRPLFRSKLVNFNENAPLEGLDRVESGRSYAFFCSLHPGMRGQLVVR